MKINVCVVTFPLGLSGYTPLSNLVRILSGLASRIYLVSGGVALEKLGKKARKVTLKYHQKIARCLSVFGMHYLKIRRIVILAYSSR